MNLEVGDIVMCTVERIAGTVVFVNIEGYGQGNIILSEIAPGRIRNLRDYVVPKKRIVCKVLRISGDNIDLSLRRVTQKDRKEAIEKDKQEKSYIKIIESVVGKKVNEIISEIQKTQKIYDFLQEAKENPKELEKIFGKENSKKILDILKTQKQKKAIIKKEFFLKSNSPEGLILIKEILGETDNVEISYISAGRYLIKAEAENLKTADNNIKEIFEQIEKQSKKNKIEFKVKEKT